MAGPHLAIETDPKTKQVLRDTVHDVTIVDLCEATRKRAELEMLLRETDPVDATILRHRFDRADHQQPIPITRLPLEHPLVLAGHTADSLYQRSSRALTRLKESPSALCRATKPLTLPELLLHPEDSDA